jgi:DNA invertase Pin-like site-specific DNA recombinase
MIGIYARQSMDKKDSISIESQIDFCKREFAGEEFKTYVDKGYSGGNINRPAFESLLADIKAGSIRRVIVYKLDRISRSTLDFASIIALLKTHNVEFVSSTEKFDTSTPIGNAMLSIIMVFAQLERETIQKRITDNYYARGKRGYYMGGRCPYGYTKESVRADGVKTSILVPDDRANIVIDMYNKYAYSDLSLGAISDHNNKQGIPAPSGGRWDSSKVSRMLHNPVYVKADADVYNYYKSKGCVISNDVADFIGTNACFLYGKREANERKYTKVENHVLSLALHEGIVDGNTWLMCQYKLDENRQIKNDGKGKHTWIAGAKCGYCDYAVSVIRSKAGKKYYSCRGKTNLKACKGHSHPVEVDDIERHVRDEIARKVNELKGASINTTDSAANSIKLKLAEVDQQIENLVSNLAEASGVVIKYINERIARLDAEKQSLINELKKSVLRSNKLSAAEIIETASNWNQLTLDEKKSICKTLISRVRIYDDSVEIEWNL